MHTRAQAIATALATLNSRDPATGATGDCLNYMYRVYGSPAPRTPAWGSAMDAWNYSPWQFKNLDPSKWIAGDLIVLGPRAGNGYGDIFLTLASGRSDDCWASDIGVMGRAGHTTLAARMAMTNRPYLGVLRDMLGNPIDPATPAAPAAPAAPAHITVSQEDDIMQYNVQDKNTKHQGPIYKVTVDAAGVHPRLLSNAERTAEVGWAAAAASETTNATAKALIQAQVAVAQLETADFKTVTGAK